MGCFDVVCALTNVPIRTGEKCHLVVLKKDVAWDTIVWLGSSLEGRFCTDTVFHGEYDDYGSIENTEPPLTDKQAHLLDTFRDHMGDNERKHFFVCDTAWQWCQEKHKDYIPYFVQERRNFNEVMIRTAGRPSLGMVSEEQEVEEIALARVLLAFSHACKHPLSGLGQYHQYGGEEVENIKGHLELVQKRLKEVEDFYASLDNE